MTRLPLVAGIGRKAASRANLLFGIAAVLIAVAGFYFGSGLSQSAQTLSASTSTSPLDIDLEHLHFGEVLAQGLAPRSSRRR